MFFAFSFLSLNPTITGNAISKADSGAVGNLGFVFLFLGIIGAVTAIGITIATFAFVVNN